jgi:hypothetical protein
MKTELYVNEFFYFVVREEGGVLNVCSGVNMDRFYPIVKGRYGIGGNPVTSGLNLINRDFCALARDRGALATFASGVKMIYPLQEGDDGTLLSGADCIGIAPTEDRWYIERIRITGASGIRALEIVQRGATGLIRKVVSCTNLGYALPDALPSPEEAQAYLDGLCEAVADAEKRAVPA